jgi:hypothetical protein
MSTALAQQPEKLPHLDRASRRSARLLTPAVEGLRAIAQKHYDEHQEGGTQ